MYIYIYIRYPNQVPLQHEFLFELIMLSKQINGSVCDLLQRPSLTACFCITSLLLTKGRVTLLADCGARTEQRERDLNTRIAGWLW